MKQDVNYITHHKAVFKRMCDEESLNSQHLSLYNALFLLWNHSEFEESFPIVRSEAMSMSKIGSANTYTACLKKLHELGYINYKPSQNPMVCSKVSFYRFDNSSDNTTNNSSDKSVVIPAVEVPIEVLRRNTENNTNSKTTKQYKPINILFDTVWDLYDYKKSKEVSKKKWAALSDEERVLAFAYIPNYIKSTPDKQFRRHFQTFLNKKTWLDEIDVKPEAPIQPIATNYQTETGEQKQVRYYEAKKLNPSLRWENFQ
tara:strand:- start:1896 stop:2669 length:774 start_codon:yes stop_codon:yes gene_type:complete